MSNGLRELRLVVRTLARNPRTTVPSILILGIGLGAAVVILSIVDAVLIRPLPYPDPEDLVVVWESSESLEAGASPPEFLDWRRSQESFEELAAYTSGTLTLLGDSLAGGAPRKVTVADVSAGFFELLGDPIQIGRGLLAADDREGAEPVVVVSHGFWRQAMGADPDPIGDTVRFDESSFKVVGVARPGLGFPGGVELWKPLMPQIAEALSVRGARYLQVLGRLKEGVTPGRAAEDLSGILGGNPESASWRARVVPLKQHLTGDVERPLWILLGAVGVLVLIAAANTGSLLLARAAGRRRKIALHAALGASRTRLLVELLAESILLALGGGLLGIALAEPILRGLVQVAPRIPDVGPIEIDGRVLLAALATALLTGLLAGLLPALLSSRFDLAGEIQEGGLVFGQGGRGRRLRRAFAISQVALTFALLAGSGLLLQSYRETVTVDPGFLPERLHTFDLVLPTYRYEDAAAWRDLFQGLGERIAGVEAVEAVAFTRNLPMSGRRMTSPVVLEDSRQAASPNLMTEASSVSPGYFRTMRIPLVAGRTFTDVDHPSAPPVAVVNEAFVRTFLRGDTWVGAQARTLFGEPVLRRIVGVVADVKHSSLTEEAPPMLYTPFAQDPSRHGTLVVRSELPPQLLGQLVRDLISEADPALPVEAATTMEDRLAASVRRPRFYMLLLSGFASLAVLLSAYGLFAISAEAVALRRHEIAIRMVLGSTPGRVSSQILREGLTLTIIGVALGLIGALAGSRVLESLLFGVEPSDAVVLVTVALVLAGVSVVACGLPARRAARVNPSRILNRAAGP